MQCITLRYYGVWEGLDVKQPYPPKQSDCFHILDP